ncbi:Eco57I restriction-modification methylase domain-containing protein, partial [Anabaena sp. FACHB-1237]|uniref:Eco57I restriction-modification methylase domain-containing protein n=1 Tax=Anabaena sp. FACHB-1237 TaxID=2692769 RepID=UPI001680D838
LIPETKAEKTKREKKIAKLNNEIDKLKVEIEDIERGKIYENTLEWRFEFPEVLNDEGVFVGFDVVIGNPPYIAIQDLKKSNFLVCNYYSTNYQTAGKGNFDIYLLFVEKALDLLNSSGLVDFIMPSLWIYNEYGKPLRSLILKSKYLSRFLDFGSSQVFLDATVYTACQQFSKQKKDYFQYLKIESYKFQFLQFKEWAKILFSQLNENNWSLGEENILKIKRKIELNSKSLGEIAQIFVGIQTSADNIYHLRKISSGIYYSKILDREVEIEDSIMKPLISGTEAKRYKVPNTDKYLLHVYQTINDFTLLNLNILKSNYPKAFEYLKTNESILRSRENNKFDNDYWYQFGRNQNLDKQTLSKIGIAQTVSDLQCFLDEDGKFFLNNVRVNGIKPINENEVNIKYLLGILNSKVANFYFKLIGKPKDNGFFEANKQFISPIPIKIANEEYQKNIESLVDQILNAKKSDPNADTSALEAEIDQMVYQLYNLTPEEIQIIESYR